MVNSLRAQLLRRLLLPMLLVTMAGGGVSYFMGLNYAGNAYDQALLGTARSVAREVEFVQQKALLDLTPKAVDLLLWDPDDQVYFRVDSDRDGLIAGSKALTPAQVDADEEVFDDSWIAGHEVRLVTIGVNSGQQQIRVSVAETLNKRNRLADEVLAAVVLPQLSLIVLAVLMVRSGVKRGLAPIGELERAAHLRTPADLTPLPETRVPLELQPFTGAINALLQRLGMAMDAQNRFIADAAHQLRTPLAALKVQMESALRERDPELRAGTIKQAIAALDRTSRLSNQLLSLARVESGAEIATGSKQFDLRAVAFEAGAAWVPKALARGADLGFDAPEQAIPVAGDPVLLAEAVNNLIDNALRYAGPGPSVTLRVEPGRAGSGPLLQVEDNGPGIPSSEWHKAFERFYRLPGSPSEGSGLGLAIVQEIARAHHAVVTLEQPEAGGLRVNLRFPP